MGRPRRLIGPLTPMEVEILHHLGEGRSPKEIGALLNRDRTSAHYHITNLRRRYRARHMMHLAVLAATEPLRAEVAAIRAGRAQPAPLTEDEDILG